MCGTLHAVCNVQLVIKILLHILLCFVPVLFQDRSADTVTHWDAMGQWLVNEYPGVLPKSTIGKAFHYLMARYNKIYIFRMPGWK
jgi:hypothetical protein